jgi:hypothetical protein
MTEAAYVLRIAPSNVDRVPEALTTDQIIIGWANAEGLLDESLSWEQFREIVRGEYYSEETTLRRAGAASGHMWRFIRGMKPQDLIVVPHGPDFYLAEVTGSAWYDVSKKEDDSAYRRPVRWLNGKRPISRQLARSALLARMKTQGTCADATDLVDEISPLLAPQASFLGRLSRSCRVRGLRRAEFGLGLQPVVQRLSIWTALLFPDEICAFCDLELRIDVHDISPLR